MSSTIPIDGGSKGYVRLHRKILDNPLFKNKPAGWFKIWIFILLRANWRESVFRPRQGEAITVPAGSFVTSLEKLGTHAALSKEHARRCLDYLERARSVTLQRTHHWTMITVVNWAAYQQSEDNAHHTEHLAEHHSEIESATRGTPHQTPHAATPSKEVKNLDKKYKSNSAELDASAATTPSKPQRAASRRFSVDPDVREWFDGKFWPLYPRHEGKSKALEAAGAKATTPERRSFYIEQLKKQLPEYARRKHENGQRVIPMASTWFNQDRAEDELPCPSAGSLGSCARDSAAGDYPEYVPLARVAG
ncbi:MAG TPA: hypothetical protein VH639_28995 [Bryobacteraceae bacterium]|jgi:hypothetical protein